MTDIPGVTGSISGSVAGSISGSILVLMLLLAPSVQATDFDVTHLAAELNRVSSELARELRFTRGYSSVRFSADRLSKEADDLVAAIRHNRSLSYQRHQFRNIVRRYRELEQALLRSGRPQNRYVYSQAGVISTLFIGLNNEFYYTSYVEPAPRRYYSNPPVYRRQPQLYGGRSVGRHGQPTRPPEQKSNGRHNRSIRAIMPASNFDHRSPVLDRQLRHDAQRNPAAGAGRVRPGLPPG